MLKENEENLRKSAELVASATGVSLDEIRSKSRLRAVTKARALFCALVRASTSLTAREIAVYLGGYDTSTVITGSNKVLSGLIEGMGVLYDRLIVKLKGPPALGDGALLDEIARLVGRVVVDMHMKHTSVFDRSQFQLEDLIREAARRGLLRQRPSKRDLADIVAPYFQCVKR